MRSTTELQLPLAGHKLTSTRVDYEYFVLSEYACSCGQINFGTGRGDNKAVRISFLEHCLAVLGAGTKVKL